MKAIKLTIKNIGIIADTVIELNKPLLLFYGEIGQGKTTLLNAVKWVFGGSFPTDIIRHGETEALIRLDLDCGSILRTFYVARDGSTKSRPLVFERDGIAVKDAVAEVKKFLNPFLLNQNHLMEMNELERKKYFASMFAVDTAGLDRDIILTEGRAAETRSKLKAYGDIDVTHVDPPADLKSLQDIRAEIIALHQESTAKLHAELAKRRTTYQEAVAATNIANCTVRDHNLNVTSAKNSVAIFQRTIENLQQQLVEAQKFLVSTQQWLKDNPRKTEFPSPAVPDTAALEQELSVPAATAEVDAALAKQSVDQIKYEQYLKNKQRQGEREADEALILSLDATVRELRSKRIARLKECGSASGIAGLEFDEAGNFSYEGTQAGMLSTSQLMKLSSALSALYPAGFGVDLLDRAESLGRSVFDFIERAKAENKTILATVVGERPAQVPAEVGVYIVEGGVVK